jgi:predicted deacylase
MSESMAREGTMHRRVRPVWGVAAAVVLFVGAAGADPPVVPGGPWDTTSEENVTPLESYPQLWATLQQIARSSQGAMTLAPAPLPSNTGRLVPVATIGAGPRAMLVIAQQHGDEYVVSESALALIRDLAGSSAEAKAIRRALTVTVVPRVNVDGFDGLVQDASGLVPPWRENYDPFCPVAPCPAFYQLGRGYDINRYHSYLDDPADDPNAGPGGVSDGANPVPEAINVRRLFDRTGAEVVMDLHHQGTYVDADGRMITASTLWPNAVLTAARLGRSAEFADAIMRSKQVVATLVTALDRYGFATITRYPGTLPPGIARNAYGLRGAASVLLELRGGIDSRSKGYLARVGYIATRAVVQALADGTLSTTDVAPAEALPERGDFVPNPRGEGEEEGEGSE